MSWGFEGDQYLAISIETRKEKGEAYSALRGFFRQYELIYVVADERDVVRLRTNYRGEEVYVCRPGLAAACPSPVARRPTPPGPPSSSPSLVFGRSSPVLLPRDGQRGPLISTDPREHPRPDALSSLHLAVPRHDPSANQNISSSNDGWDSRQRPGTTRNRRWPPMRYVSKSAWSIVKTVARDSRCARWTSVASAKSIGWSA
jgi:Domain of unknown function (DUF4105)